MRTGIAMLALAVALVLGTYVALLGGSGINFSLAAVLWSAALFAAVIGVIRIVRTARAASDSERSRLYAALVHLGGLTLYLGVPLGHLVVPLACWLAGRGDPQVDRAGRGALDFQLLASLLLATILLLSVLLVGLIMLPVLILAHVAITFAAFCVTLRRGDFSYPVTVRILSRAGDG